MIGFLVRLLRRYPPPRIEARASLPPTPCEPPVVRGLPETIRMAERVRQRAERHIVDDVFPQQRRSGEVRR